MVVGTACGGLRVCSGRSLGPEMCQYWIPVVPKHPESGVNEISVVVQIPVYLVVVGPPRGYVPISPYGGTHIPPDTGYIMLRTPDMQHLGIPGSGSRAYCCIHTPACVRNNI